MNERDKELAEQAGFNSFDTECYEGLDVLIDLIRADECEALIRYFDGHWRDEWSEGQIIEALEARGNICNP